MHLSPFFQPCGRKKISALFASQPGENSTCVEQEFLVSENIRKFKCLLITNNNIIVNGMEISAKSSLSLGFRYLVFSLLIENKKLLSILMNILILLSWFAVSRIISIIIFIMVFIISIVFVKIIYMKVAHCSLYLITQRYTQFAQDSSWWKSMMQTYFCLCLSYFSVQILPSSAFGSSHETSQEEGPYGCRKQLRQPFYIFNAQAESKRSKKSQT